MATHVDPDARHIGMALKTIGGSRVQKNRIHFYPVPIDRLIEYADEIGVCDAETIIRVVNRPPRPELVKGGMA